MAKQIWRPGNMLYPLPSVMVTVADKEGNHNIITLAWAGTVNSNPAMVSISVRKSRHSHHMLEETGEFVINLVTEDLCRAMDYCGVRSGRDVDKFQEMNLTPVPAAKVTAPLIEESPICIECRVRQKIELGSHDMFLADVLCVQADEKYLDENGSLDLDSAHLLVYNHGTYYGLGEKLGTFGYSVRKKPAQKQGAKGSGRKETGAKESGAKGSARKTARPTAASAAKKPSDRKRG